MIKKSLITVIITLAFVTLAAGLAGRIETHYTREAIVIDINENSNEVFVIDATGNEWSFFDEGFTRGNKVKLNMNTMHTDSNITDDVIESVKVVNN